MIHNFIDCEMFMDALSEAMEDTIEHCRLEKFDVSTQKW